MENVFNTYCNKKKSLTVDIYQSFRVQQTSKGIESQILFRCYHKRVSYTQTLRTYQIENNVTRINDYCIESI